MTITGIRFVSALAVAGSLLVGCSSYKTSGGDAPRAATGDTNGTVAGEGRHATLNTQAQHSIDVFKRTDPSLSRFFENAAGYAVFPEVKKGAVGVGGASGDGVVYQDGRVIGHAKLRQATIGLQLGGQTYSELIFLQTDADLDRFKRNEVEFAAQASAVAAAKDSGANADYSEGVAIFTSDREGLMFEASIGGQKFDYWPVD